MRSKFTIRRLEYFVAVSEAGSVTGAAEKLNVSSPSVSASILQMEEELGMQLFIRRQSRGLALTNGGRLFYKEVKKVLERVNNLHNVIADITETVSGTLRLGCLQTVAPLILPQLRKSFEEKFPNACVDQMEDHQATLLECLQNAELDLCLTYDLDIPADIGFDALVNLPAYVMLTPTHPLAGRHSISPEDLKKEEMILLDLPISSKYFMSMFRTARIKPKIAGRTKDMALVRSMVANGLGYSLGNLPPKSEYAPDGKRLKHIPLKSGLRPMQLGLASIKTNYKTRVVEAFEAHCKEMLTKENVRGIAVAGNKK